MLYWIYDYPTAAMSAAFALAFLAFTWAGLFLVRPLVRPWVIPRSGPTTWSASRSQASVLYGLLFGLFAVASYQNYSTVYGNVDNEVASACRTFSRSLRLSAAFARETGG